MSRGEGGADDPPRFILTAHARIAVGERGIDLAWVGRVLSQPERVEPDRTDPALRHALGRVLERGDRVLRVVSNRTVVPWPVVTVFFDRAQRKKR